MKYRRAKSNEQHMQKCNDEINGIDDDFIEPCRSRENTMRNQVIEIEYMNPSSNARNRRLACDQ